MKKLLVSLLLILCSLPATAKVDYLFSIKPMVGMTIKLQLIEGMEFRTKRLCYYTLEAAGTNYTRLQPRNVPCQGHMYIKDMETLLTMYTRDY